MIVLVRPDATAETVRDIVKAVKDLGLDVLVLHDVDQAKGQAFEVTGGDPGRVLSLAGRPGVAQILTRRTPLVGGEPLWPHFALRVGILVLLLLTALVLISAFLPVGLADSAVSQAVTADGHVEWYLRPLEGMSRLVPEGLRPAGGAALALFCLLLLVWPLVDKGPPDADGAPGGPASSRSRLLRIAGGAIFLALVALGFLP